MIRNRLLTTAVTAAVTAVLFVGGCNGKIDLDSVSHLIKAGQHGWNANALSEKDEDALGQSIGVAITSQYGLSQDARLQHYVMLVGLTVASASPNPAGNWVFGVLDTSEVNAFSGPGGYVFVTRGAIERMRDEAELAGVLAHEISHVCHHDGLKLVKAAETRGAAGELMQAGKEDTQFSSAVDNGFEALTKSGYSQPQEFSADKSGVEIMAAAGYNPSSYLHFLQRMVAEGSAEGAGKVMSTHPGMPQRVERISQQILGMEQKGIRGGATLAGRFAASVHSTGIQGRVR